MRKIYWQLKGILSSACRAGTWGVGCRACNCNSTVCDRVTGCTSCGSNPSLTGPNCDQHVDVCPTNPCDTQTSTCIDTPNTYYCRCKPWYQPWLSYCQRTYIYFQEIYPIRIYYIQLLYIYIFYILLYIFYVAKYLFVLFYFI